MKTFTTILLGILLIAAIGGYWYLQKNKKHIVKDSIDSMLKKKTDSLYFVHYDSSKIDEVKGDASFYNVYLQSDSIQKEVLAGTDSLPKTMYNIHVDEIKVAGVDIAGLLENESIAAKKILLNEPVVQVINTGSNKPVPSSYNDTLELYKRILGKFKSIHADTIQVTNGIVLITDKNGNALTIFKNINVTLNNFLVDSVHNYQNVISYFIKDVKVTVDSIQLPESNTGTRINIGGLAYDAPKKILHVNQVLQYRVGVAAPLIDLKNININTLNTDEFIVDQQLKAGMITCDGGIITVYKNGNKSQSKDKNPEINFSSDLIDEVAVDGMNLGSTNVIIIDTSNSKEKPFILNDVRFTVSKVNNVTDGTKISDIINNAAWQLSVGSFLLSTKNKLYDITAAGVQLDNVKQTVSVHSIQVQPKLSEQQFVRQSIHQRDRFDLLFNNIALQGVNFKELISDNKLEVNNGSLQPIIKVFNDRTVPPDSSSKVSKYPNQQLIKLNFPFYIKELKVNNGYVAYTERSKQSLKTGTVFFSNINATLTNITNIDEKVKANELLTLRATALFMGAGKLTSQWQLPLTLTDTSFTVKGNLGTMNTSVLNPLIEPLGMVSVKNGTINRLTFNIRGGNYRSTGKVLFLYKDLHVKVLKKDKDNNLKSKNIESIIADAAIKSDNPLKGNNRTGTIDFNRDTTKSFFNFLWKSVFSGVKKIAL
ncbi:MAG TPA: hypothetical protein VK559_08245 [Ferruginibacter sp.]|nr:hypothetical protein [Ferruginibacter sp.]